MANRSARQVSYSKFRGQGALPEGLLAVDRPQGEDLARVSESFAGLARKTGAIADRLAAKEGEIAGLKAGQEGTPKLRNDATIRGEAYDRAAIDAFAWRLEVKVTTQLAEAYGANRDSPKALADSFEKIKQEYLVEADLDGDPKLKEIFARSFETKSAAYLADAKARVGDRAQAAASTAAGELIDAQRNEVERQAYLLPPGAEGDTALDDLTGRASRQIDAMLASRAISKATAAKEKEAIADGARRARLRSVFDTLPDAESKAAFASGLVKEWAAGSAPLKGFDFKSITTIADGYATDARQEASTRAANERSGPGLVKGKAVDLIATGKMTLDWAEAHRDDMDEATYRAARRAAGDGPPPSAGAGGRDYLSLADLAERNPAAAVAEAREAYADGRLGQEEFGHIIARAKNKASPKAEEEKRPYFKTARSFVNAGAAPAPGDATTTELQDYRDTMDIFDDWVLAHPQAEQSDVRQFADTLVTERRKQLAIKRRATLPVPSLSLAPIRESFGPNELVRTAERLARAVEKGTISREAAAREARLLRLWETTLRDLGEAK